MMNGLLLGLFFAFGWLVILCVSEFARLRRGYGNSFAITQWLWDNVAWIRKVPW